MVSLAITVLNEVDNLPRWLSCILAQSLLPDEIIIVDGGSNDGTWEWLQDQAQKNKRLNVFKHVGNIALGRNFAIGQAKGEIIVVTDAGCVYRSNWLKDLVAPLFFSGAKFSTTAFAPWLEKSDGLLSYLIAASTVPAASEFKKDWLPSSRSVAFYKKLWQDVGGYPEWIPICEDVIFDLEIKKKGANLAFVRECLVCWRPRTSLRTYFTQLFRYTRSDGHGNLWLHRQLIRYVTYLFVLVLLFLSVYFSPLILLLIFGGALIYMKKFWLRWLEFSIDLRAINRVVGFFLMPLVVGWGDVAKMCGWPVGVLQRLTGKVLPI